MCNYAWGGGYSVLVRQVICTSMCDNERHAITCMCELSVIHTVLVAKSVMANANIAATSFCHQQINTIC